MTPGLQKIVWPAAVAVALLALWQGLVTAFEVPVFLLDTTIAK